MKSFKECSESISKTSELNYSSISEQQKVKNLILINKKQNNNLKFLKVKDKNCWSSSKIEDEIVLHLSSYTDAEIIDEKELLIRHPYQEEAEYLLYRINLAKPIPDFIIYECLLPQKLRQELLKVKQYRYEFNKIVTNALKRLYESVDYEYFHTCGIGGKIYWRIEP